jgi:hypothetical protein
MEKHANPVEVRNLDAGLLSVPANAFSTPRAARAGIAVWRSKKPRRGKSSIRENLLQVRHSTNDVPLLEHRPARAVIGIQY